MHITRQKTNKSWPIPRKGTKYVIRPSSNVKTGIPLLIVVRDILKIAKNREEFKKIANQKEIFVNNKPVKEAKYSLLLFDVLSLKSLNKNYRIAFSGRKIGVEEIKAEQAKHKICSVIDKKTLRGNKLQLNLSDGRNILSGKEGRINIGDSLVVNFENKKIDRIIPLKIGAKVLMIRGKHKGNHGAIREIENKKIGVEIKDNKFYVKLNELIVVE